MMGNRGQSQPASSPMPIGSISYYEFLIMGRKRRQPASPIVDAPIQVPATIRQVFIAWKKILVDTGYFTPSSNVIVSLDEDEYPPSGISYCLLCPLIFLPDDGSVNGGGRFNTILDGQFSVIVRTRNRMNLAYQDSYLLENEDPATGVMALADTVMDKLQCCFPVDDSGNSLVAEPPRFAYWAKASRAGTQSEWGGIKLLFSVSIQQYLPSSL